MVRGLASPRFRGHEISWEGAGFGADVEVASRGVLRKSWEKYDLGGLGGRRVLHRLAIQTQLFHAASQCVRMQIEDSSRTVGAFNDPLGLGQDIKNMPYLDLLQ